MRSNWMLACMTAGWMSVSASWGQVAPPAPPRTTPTPEYTPPPPPPTPPRVAPRNANPPSAQPATPEKPLPSLIERAEDGTVIRLDIPAGEAAIRALNPDEETMKKVEASLAARRDDLDRLVIEHVEGLAELRTFAREVSESTPMDQIQTKAKNVHPFRTFPGVLDRLSREGAIDPQLKSRASKVADEYQKAVEAELTKGFEHSNTQQMVLVGFRRFLFVTTTEAYAALDRQLAAAAPRAAALFDQIGLKGDMKSRATSRMRAAQGDDAQREALEDVFFNILGPDERGAFLRAANPKLFPQKNADQDK